MVWPNCAVFQRFSFEQLCIRIQHLCSSPYHSPERWQHDYHVDWIYVWQKASSKNISVYLGKEILTFNTDITESRLHRF